MLCFECVAHFAGPVDGGHGDYGYDYGYDDGGYGGYGYEDYGGYGYGGQSCVLLRVLFKGAPKCKICKASSLS